MLRNSSGTNYVLNKHKDFDQYGSGTNRQTDTGGDSNPSAEEAEG